MKLRDWLFGTLRRQLAVGVALVHAVMMSVFVFDLVVRQQEVLQARQADEARSLARTLALSARAWVLTRDLAGLAELTRIDGDNGVEYMMLIDARGEVLAHTDPARVGQYLADMQALIAQPAPQVAALGSSPKLADVVAPVVAAGRVVGWARVGVGPGEHAAVSARIVRDGMLYTLVAIVIGALLAVLMSRAITARLQQIRDAADAVRAGQHELRVPDDGRTDEVGAVARGFNAMLDALAHKRSLLRSLVETLPDMVWMKDTEGRYLLCNRALGRVFGRAEADVIGRTDHELLPADFADHLRRHDQRAIDAGQPVRNEEWVTLADDGQRVFVETVKAPMYDAEGKLIGVVGIARDYTERLRAAEQLRLSASVFAACVEGIVITDAEHRIIDANPAFTRITGFARDEVIGRTSAFLSSVRHGPEFHAALWATMRQQGVWRGEMWTRSKFGEEVAQQVSIAALRDDGGQITHYIKVFTDISDLKAHEAELNEIAHHDPLTGLPNRRLLRDRFNQAYAQAARGRHGLGVALVDLDGFKPINDSLGHEAGDQVLRTIAERLGHCLRGGDTVARLGGDEFVLLLVNLADADEAGQVLERVLHAVAQPITLGGQAVQVSASIGLTVFPHDPTDPDTLLRHADAAMYSAKEAGRNTWRLYGGEGE